MAAKLLPYFPPHDIYVEPFFGAGGMFFNKPRAAHNFLNDSDNEVFNLYMVAIEEPDRLRFELERLPLHQTLWAHWKKVIPDDRVLRAVRFLMYSNFGYMGSTNSLHIAAHCPKITAIRDIDALDFGDCKFTCGDFEVAILAIKKTDLSDGKAFIYADPPYLTTGHNYEHGDQWNESEHERLHRVLIATGSKFAISEFNHPAVIEMAKANGLRIHEIGTRQSMKNRNMEILITNYEPSIQQSLF